MNLCAAASAVLPPPAEPLGLQHACDAAQQSAHDMARSVALVHLQTFCYSRKRVPDFCCRLDLLLATFLQPKRPPFGHAAVLRAPLEGEWQEATIDLSAWPTNL